MKSYWQKMSCEGRRAQDAALSWFSPLSDGMTVVSADILCDIETDKEKKIRAVMVDADGKKLSFTRTLGKRFSISRRPL